MDYLIGHLVGDYLLQTDWQAQNKTWPVKRWRGLPIALYHAGLWTLAIFLCGMIAGKVWPWWALLVIWMSHAVQDWTRFPTKWMEWRNQWIHFRENLPQAYVWACIVVDNTIHGLMLFILRELIT